jgi:ATP synthase protein I
MSENDKPSDLAGLDARLKEAQLRQEQRRPPSSKNDSGAGLGMALRMGAELVAGVFVGVGIGWLLDGWLGTRPWLTVVFLFIGFAAGVVSMVRTASGAGHAVGYRAAPPAKRDGDDKTAS